jgi:hypothetical protein
MFLRDVYRLWRRHPGYVAWLGLYTSWQGRRFRPLFEDIETICLFLGHGRSGHSLVAALLDAHSQAAVADEIDSLRLLKAGFRREQYFAWLLLSARAHGAATRRKGGRRSPRYSYDVPGQWQGRWRRPVVVGEASLTTARLTENPHLLETLRGRLRVSLRFIQIVRNPYDSISRLALVSGAPLPHVIEHYFWVSQRVQEIAGSIAEDERHIVRHECLVASPTSTLNELGRFLRLDMTPDYLQACSDIVFDKPRRTRRELNWPRKEIDAVAERLRHYEFLAGYGFET